MTEAFINTHSHNLSDNNNNNDSPTIAKNSLGNASTFIYSGRAYARTGYYTQAIDNLQHAIQLEPTKNEAFYYLGLIYIKIKQYKDARNILKKAIENSNTTSNIDLYRCYFKYAFACQMDNQFIEAIKYYTKFVQNVNTNDRYPGLLNRGICYDKLEKYTDALRDFDRALILTNNQSKPYCLSCRAKVKAKMNDQIGALKDYDQAVTQTAAFIEKNFILKNLNNTTNVPFPFKHSIPITKVLQKSGPSSPLYILLNALEKDNDDDSSNAMNDYNKLLDSTLEQLQEQIYDLELEKQSEQDSNELKIITYNIAKANLVMETIDKHQTAMERFSNNDNLQTFYCSIYFRLEEIIVACKSIASGRVKSEEGKLEQHVEFITLVNKTISIVPIVGQPLGLFVKPASKIIQAIDYKQQKNTMMKIASLGCILDLWKVFQNVAETLTILYEPLILQLISLQQEKVLVEQVSETKCYDSCTKSNWRKLKYMKRKQQLLKEELYIKQAREIGEYAVALILDALLKEKIIHDNNKTLYQQFIDVICIPSEDYVENTTNVEVIFKNHKLSLQNSNKQWTLDGFYHEPGIVTSDREYYHRIKNNTKLYGYRNGTKEEAIRLGFVPRV